jgi:hypothetical protein
MALGVESGIHGAHMREAPDEEPGTDEENDRERDLRNDEATS